MRYQTGTIFLKPLKPWGGGRCTAYAHPSLSFCLLLKIIMRHPYLKILDLANLFVADAPMKIKIKKFSFTPSRSTFKYWSVNRPWVRGLKQCYYCTNMRRMVNFTPPPYY